MRLSLAIPVLALTLGSALLGWSLLTTPASPARTAPASGMAILGAYRCQPGEERHIVLRGAEDGFSPVGNEPTSLRLSRRNPHNLTFYARSRYDQDRPDRPFTDSLRLPPRITSGLLVVGLRAIGGNGNDSFTLGDLTPSADGAPVGDAFGATVPRLEKDPGWRRQGNVYAASLEDIPVVRDGGGGLHSLLDLIQSGRTQGWLDVGVEDDTSVDFVGVAVCAAPAPGRGLTLAKGGLHGPTPPGILFLACRWSATGQRVCDPYEGDAPCDRPLPLACLKPGDAPSPASLKGQSALRSWSGGRMALSTPVAASRFARIGDADAYCAAQFGPGWRTGALHDGIVEGIAAYGDAPGFDGRAWVDIADQPRAVCWAH